MPLHLKMKLPERLFGAPEHQSQSQGSPRSDSDSSAVPSFQSIYQQYFDFVWSSARQLGVDAEAVDDVVQEIFIVIYARLDTLERPEALRSWIYGIARRTVSTYRRARHTRRSMSPEAAGIREVPSLSPTPLERTETNADLRLLASLLDELDELKREVFVLVEVEGLSAPEVAALLDVPLNTIYSRLRAARLAFDAALARHEARNKAR